MNCDHFLSAPDGSGERECLWCGKVFQQRRSRASLSLATAIIAVLLLCSCASLTPERVNLIMGLAAQAAQIGTQIWLDQHPTHRQAFASSVTAFTDAVKTGKTNAVEYLNSLPTATLTGPESALYVTGNRLVVWDDVAGKSYAVTNLSQIAGGLKRGMAPLPPHPSGRKRLVPGTNTAIRVPPVSPALEALAARSRAIPNPIDPPPLSDADMDRQFEDVKANLAAGRVTDYVVERKVGEGWASVVLITNAPIGEWRVRRAK